VIPEGKTGYCTTRKNEGGILKSLVYAQLVSMNIDPIEKKPLFHFLPGTPILSVATAGCNLRCVFCQNWTISQALPGEVESENVSPENLVSIAKAKDCPSIAYTYKDGYGHVRFHKPETAQGPLHRHRCRKRGP
jgi:pyruvate formate lyase activating enzyme